MPKISVIMPVYKTEATVAAAIESVLSQTEQDFELICVDDGSPDRAGEVLSRYAAQDSRIRVFKQENRGLSGARNTGLDHAVGEYVTFLDSDDALPRYALSLFLKAAEATGAAVVVSEGPADVSTEGEKRKASDVSVPSSSAARVSDTPLRAVLAGRRMRSSAWNKFYRRETIGARRFVEGILFEDWPFVTELLGSIDRVAIVSAPCYVYSKIGESIVRSAFSMKKVESYVEGIRQVHGAMRDRPTWPYARKRCALAAAMMINKVSSSHDPELGMKARSALSELHKEGAFRYRDLPLKSAFRMMRLPKVPKEEC